MNRTGVLLSGRYQLMEEIGSGGMADVYKASDIKLNRIVAVKILKNEFSKDESFVLKFQQEAMAAASIQNPNVVNVYDVGEDDGVNYIVMEIAEGMTLKEYIRKKGKLDIIETINISMQIVNGIRDAHANHIIHRDIKPQNVMVTTDLQAKVMDFGIAKAVTTQTITANTVGSVHYISPEQARGGVCDERCDIYSIGITMYEMITGRVPFDGESTVAVALAHIKEPMVPPSTYEPMIPVSLEKIVMKCTQKKPEMRYANADELLDDLKKALMSPDEDFVKEVVVPKEGGTKVFSDEETKQIKELSAIKDLNLKSREEEDYQLGIEENAEEEKPVEEAEEDSRMEKFILFAGIVALIAAVLIAGILLAKTFHLFPSKTPEETTIAQTESVEIVTTEEADNSVSLPGGIIDALYDTASEKLKDLGLVVKTEFTSSNDVALNHVISVSDNNQKTLGEGASLMIGDTVILTVSSGREPVLIPDSITGMAEKAAEKFLTRMELEVDIVREESDDVDEGLVIRCEPGVGEQVPVGSKVTLYISDGNGKIMTTVPELVGKTVDIAKSMLSAADLASDPQFEYSDEYPLNMVIRQDIEPGTSVEANTDIVYYVSLGAQTTAVPMLSGTREDAEAALTAAGLTLGEVKTDYSDTVSEGNIISQSIENGTQVKNGTAIDIVISLGRKIIMVTIPDVTGKTEAEAVSSLEAKGFTAVKGGTEYNSLPEGQVIRTSPESGAEAEEGSKVTYYVSKGPEEVVETTTEAPATTQTTTAAESSAQSIEETTKAATDGE